MAGGEAEVMVEAAGERMVGGLGAVAPFPESRGGVAGRLKNVSDGSLIGIEAFAARSRRIDAATWIVATREEFGPRGRANGLRVEIRELSALVRESIEMGCI